MKTTDPVTIFSILSRANRSREAALLPGGALELTSPVGFLAPVTLARLIPDPAVFVVEWQRTHALQSILRFLGCTIDSVVSNRSLAAEVRILWRHRKAAEHQETEVRFAKHHAELVTAYLNRRFKENLGCGNGCLGA